MLLLKNAFITNYKVLEYKAGLTEFVCVAMMMSLYSRDLLMMSLNTITIT